MEENHTPPVSLSKLVEKIKKRRRYPSGELTKKDTNDILAEAEPFKKLFKTTYIDRLSHRVSTEKAEEILSELVEHLKELSKCYRETGEVHEGIYKECLKMVLKAYRIGLGDFSAVVRWVDALHALGHYEELKKVKRPFKGVRKPYSKEELKLLERIESLHKEGYTYKDIYEILKQERLYSKCYKAFHKWITHHELSPE